MKPTKKDEQADAAARLRAHISPPWFLGELDRNSKRPLDAAITGVVQQFFSDLRDHPYTTFRFAAKGRPRIHTCLAAALYLMRNEGCKEIVYLASNYAERERAMEDVFMALTPDLPSKQTDIQGWFRQEYKHTTRGMEGSGPSLTFVNQTTFIPEINLWNPVPGTVLMVPHNEVLFDAERAPLEAAIARHGVTVVWGLKG